MIGRDAADELFSWVAITLARRGQPHPNPHVGALVVEGGQLVGVGHHERAGLPHAEIVALRHAGARARGATLYVTLEPCNHYGRTPPCVDQIVRAGIVRVVALCPDPNPHVQGGGLRALRERGLEVAWGPGRADVEAMLSPWFAGLLLGKVADGQPIQGRPVPDVAKDGGAEGVGLEGH